MPNIGLACNINYLIHYLQIENMYFGDSIHSTYCNETKNLWMVSKHLMTKCMCLKMVRQLRALFFSEDCFPNICVCVSHFQNGCRQKETISVIFSLKLPSRFIWKTSLRIFLLSKSKRYIFNGFSGFVFTFLY